MTGTFHILNEFVWPDAAPTAIYAEQLARALAQQGKSVQLVGGRGRYREGNRPHPGVPLVLLGPDAPARGRLTGVLRGYFRTTGLFHRYIRSHVATGDVVIASSAPPLTPVLHRAIREKKARSIYWMQDYYPEMLRSLIPFPSLWVKPLSWLWDRELRHWDEVVKIAGNLGGDIPRARIIRNWATLVFSPGGTDRDKTALYTGNLGYAHDIDALVAACSQLRDDGYRVVFYADGPGVARLPGWVEKHPPCRDESALLRILSETPLHLLSAHPRFQGALFPSKFWNSHASGARMIATGFSGKMLDEYNTALETNPCDGLDQWVRWLDS